MKWVETEFWRLCMPEDWPVEQEDDSVVIEDPDGLGCLCITELVPELNSPEKFGPEALMQASGANAHKRMPCTLGDFDGWEVAFEEEGEWIREWYLGDDQRVLMVSYSCDPEDKHMDAELIDQILDTLEAPLEPLSELPE